MKKLVISASLKKSEKKQTHTQVVRNGKMGLLMDAILSSSKGRRIKVFSTGQNVFAL